MQQALLTLVPAQLMMTISTCRMQIKQLRSLTPTLVTPNSSCQFPRWIQTRQCFCYYYPYLSTQLHLHLHKQVPEPRMGTQGSFLRHSGGGARDCIRIYGKSSFSSPMYRSDINNCLQHINSIKSDMYRASRRLIISQLQANVTSWRFKNSQLRMQLRFLTCMHPLRSISGKVQKIRHQIALVCHELLAVRGFQFEDVGAI